MKKILITGTGLVAKKLAQKLSKNQNEVIFLSTTKKEAPFFYWNINDNYLDEKALDGVSIIIHLAGANIADKKWTSERKKEIQSSRIDSAKLILEQLKKRNQKIEQFISASAIGYYGAITTEKILDETHEPLQNDFLSETCKLWEAQSLEFKKQGIAQNSSIHRFGVIFDKNEGALPKILQSFKFKIATILGSGKQWIPWVDIEDVVRQLEFSLQNRIDGIYNCVTDIEAQVRFEDLIKILAKKHNIPFTIKVPKLALKLALGEMSMLILEGTRINNKKIKDLGFQYLHTSLDNY
jgi:hypothetical protein